MPEVVIALSALVLGAAVAARLRVPFGAAAVIVGAFAIFHGHAHGAELPSAANPLAYGVGFVVATGLLHLCGIALGTLSRWPAGERLTRGLGAAIAALGCLLPGGQPGRRGMSMFGAPGSRRRRCLSRRKRRKRTSSPRVSATFTPGPCIR